jgi:hypothetical protein
MNSNGEERLRQFFVSWIQIKMDTSLWKNPIDWLACWELSRQRAILCTTRV